MNNEEYHKFRHDSIHELRALNDACERNFAISAWPRWDYELDDGVLVFSENDVPKVIADIQVVGTTANESNTWMWGWANDSLPPRAVSRMGAIREFGIAESIPQLTTDLLPNDEYLGWELTAVTARLLGAKGAYRCSDEDGFLYLVYMDIRPAQGGESPTESDTHDSARIECATHGTAQTTYVCEHLLADPEQEWFSEAPGEANPWPDAWCASCDAFFQEQGEWNDSNSGSVQIKLICNHCYEIARSKAVE